MRSVVCWLVASGCAGALLLPSQIAPLAARSRPSATLQGEVRSADESPMADLKLHKARDLTVRLTNGEPLATAIQSPNTTATLFENARVVAGDGRAPIADAAFVVQNGRFTQVGTRAAVSVPAGAQRVDLGGKTVIPALVDAHVHLGYRRATTFTADNYTRDNLLDELDRFSYYGIAAVLEAGTGRGALPFRVRQEPHTGARYLTAGRGLAMPNAGPGVPMRDAAYGVTSEAEARHDVQELAASRADLIKIWVDDRNGTVEKLRPDLYRAIIDEAHTHGLRVMAHIAALEDAKDLLRAGVDGFAHVVRDKDIDQELLAMLGQRPNVFFVATLWGERNAIYGARPAWLGDRLMLRTFSDAEASTLAAGFATSGPRDSAERLLRNVAALSRAGVRVGLGTDTGGVSGGGYFGLASLVELELLVKAGLTPLQAITAGTRTSAAILRLDSLGAIAPGKSAAFVVLDGDPLENIANTRKISAVYLDGQAVDRDALQRRWSAAGASARQ
jgi:imidazolonepropionase-like amidohydrolase